MSLVEHARLEFELCGQAQEDPGYTASLIAAIAAFASYGHSGGSAMVAREQLYTLLNFGNLSPLTADPDEWIDRSEMSGYPMWQSRRNSQAFSADGGATYWLQHLPGHPHRLLNEYDEFGHHVMHASAPQRRTADDPDEPPVAAASNP